MHIDPSWSYFILSYTEIDHSSFINIWVFNVGITDNPVAGTPYSLLTFTFTYEDVEMYAITTPSVPD